MTLDAFSSTEVLMTRPVLPREMQEPPVNALTREPGRTAYEARFFGAAARTFDPWKHLPDDARAIWARVECEVLAADAQRRASEQTLKFAMLGVRLPLSVPMGKERLIVDADGHTVGMVMPSESRSLEAERARAIADAINAGTDAVAVEPRLQLAAE